MKEVEIEEEFNQIESIHFLLASGIVALFGKVYEIKILFFVAVAFLLFGFYLMFFNTKKTKGGEKQ